MGVRFIRTTALLLVLLLFTTAVSFAASVVSPVPNSVVYSDSILVSVKVNEKATIKVTVYEEKSKDSSGNLISTDVSKMTTKDLESLDLSKYTDSVYSAAVTYTNEGEIGFYTKQLSGVKPGLYRVKVDTLNDKGDSVATVSSLVAVNQKEEKQEQNIFQNQRTTGLQLIQNLIKKIFK